MLRRCPVLGVRPLARADLLSFGAAVLAALPAVYLLVAGVFGVGEDGVPFLTLPPVLLVAPVVARGTAVARPLRFVVAIAMLGFAFLAALSIGSLYLPAGIVALAAALSRT